MRQQKYFNNNKTKFVANRRDADKLIETSHKTAMLLAMTVLHDKYGFGFKRLEKFLYYYEELLDGYNKGYFTPNDLNGELEKVGFKVI